MEGIIINTEYNYNVYKEDFLRHIKNDKPKQLVSYTSFFEKIENFDSKGKDILEFDFSDIKELFLYLIENDIRSPSSLEGDVSRLKTYFEFSKISKLSAIDIDKKIKIDNNGKKGVELWLENLGAFQVTKDYYISIDDIKDIEDQILKKQSTISYQNLAVVCLLFLGFTLKKIVEIKSVDILNWDEFIVAKNVFPSEIKDISIRIIKKADEQVSVPKRNSKATYQNKYHNSEFFMKSGTNKSNDKMNAASLTARLKKIEENIKKKKLDETSIRKSGMLYLGSSLIKNANIKTYNELKDFVYAPICSIYNEYLDSYSTTLNSLFGSSLLEEFYDVRLPEDLKKHVNKNSRDNDNSIHTKRKIPLPPPKRSPTDKKTYEENEEKGKNGEDRVVGYFEDIGCTAYLVPDKLGYDIYLKTNYTTEYIEVKTMTNKKSAINITKHEFDVANDMIYKDAYWFYILVWDQDNDKSLAELYVFKNFFEIIGLQDKKDEIFRATYPILGDKVTKWTYRDFSLTLNEDIFNLSTFHFNV